MASGFFVLGAAILYQTANAILDAALRQTGDDARLLGFAYAFDQATKLRVQPAIR